MPIIGFYCTNCRANVPLNHFDECDAVHPDFAAAVVADSQKVREPGIHVSTIIGCPRKAAIETAADVYINPLGYNSILGGTAWHRLMEQASKHPTLCEVAVRGAVGGVELVGRVDRLHPPTGISDWKVTSEWAEKWLVKDGMKDEHLAQMSLYGELVEQTLGWRPMTGTAWYRTHKTMLPFTKPLWSLEQVMNFHPLDGDYSVGELLKMSAAEAVWRGSTWQALPLAGESMKYGQKTACDYCSVRDVCYTQAKGAPF